jgi:drug/metabolite transporter (DMT)-like permease
MCIRKANVIYLNYALYERSSFPNTLRMSSPNESKNLSSTDINLPDASKSPTDGKLFVLAGGLIFGTLGVFVEEAKQDALTTVWFRCAFGALALLAWSWFSGTTSQLRLHGSSWRIVLSTGCLMILMWALFFASIARTSIAVATVVFHIQPLLVMTLGAWWLREKVTRLQWSMSLLALFGLVLATGLLDGLKSTHYSERYLIGLLMCFGGAFAYAIVTLIAKTNRSISAVTLVTWQCLLGTLLMAWWPWLHGWPTQLDSLAWLTGLGLIHTGLAYVLIYTGMARLSTGNIAAMQFVYPVTAVLVDWAVYGRMLSVAQLVGVVLMAIAIGVVSRAR